eukprot:TRINITY_DN7636_c0_g1_i1.p1 TRINITY_DN7636_c0_g1~~TRINITY_DN7636_c0_g1_i1.p1  ORF type:complete len:744 (+),score=183.52 TRINITY_DN7636_c0_g1_i1:895-3126(+)
MMFMVFGVSWLTEEIGISALLGAFEFGLAVPKRGPLIKEMRSRLEDFVVVIMLPIFFTLIGLKTNFALLDTWDLWLIMLMLAVVATAVKAPGVMIPGKLFGLDWFDTMTFGVLMSCKGLVALTIYNLALTSELITPLFFTILVGYVMITMFLVTPFVQTIAWAKRLWQGKKTKKKSNTYGVFMLPRTPGLAAPIATIANSLIALPRTNAAGKPMDTRLVIARVVDPNDRIVGLPTRKQLKQDNIFAAATQRMHFFKRKMDYEYIVTTNPEDDVLERVNNGPPNGKTGRESVLLLGDDETPGTRDILAHILSQTKLPVAIYTGPDVGNRIGKIMLPYRDTPHDRLALEFVRAIAHTASRPKIIVLLLPGSPPASQLDFLKEIESEDETLNGGSEMGSEGESDEMQSSASVPEPPVKGSPDIEQGARRRTSQLFGLSGKKQRQRKQQPVHVGTEYWFGKKAKVTISDRRDQEEIDVMGAITHEMNRVQDIELVIMGRFDVVGSEVELKHVLHRFVEKLCACLYVSDAVRDSSEESAAYSSSAESDPTASTTAGDHSESETSTHDDNDYDNDDDDNNSNEITVQQPAKKKKHNPKKLLKKIRGKKKTRGIGADGNADDSSSDSAEDQMEKGIGAAVSDRDDTASTSTTDDDNDNDNKNNNNNNNNDDSDNNTNTSNNDSRQHPEAGAGVSPVITMGDDDDDDNNNNSADDDVEMISVRRHRLHLHHRRRQRQRQQKQQQQQQQRRQ